MPDIGEYIPGYESRKDFVEAQSQLLAGSYLSFTGRPLIEIQPGATPAQIAQAVFFAPVVILSGGNEEDQILNYGNAAAIKLWETTWDELTLTPSRLTAEPVHREQRARFLENVRQNGFVTDYQGIRISRKGKRFHILEATVWNLTDPFGNFRGQAAAFSKYNFLD